jgi:hypothetical protein
MLYPARCGQDGRVLTIKIYLKICGRPRNLLIKICGAGGPVRRERKQREVNINHNRCPANRPHQKNSSYLETDTCDPDARRCDPPPPPERAARGAPPPPHSPRARCPRTTRRTALVRTDTTRTHKTPSPSSAERGVSFRGLAALRLLLCLRLEQHVAKVLHRDLGAAAVVDDLREGGVQVDVSARQCREEGGCPTSPRPPKIKWAGGPAGIFELESCAGHLLQLAVRHVLALHEGGFGHCGGGEGGFGYRGGRGGWLRVPAPWRRAASS